jgi:putative transposase
LSDIIGSYKSAVAKYANSNINKSFAWQTRFYERVIRNDTELFNIRNYIKENPQRWEIDKDGYDNIKL